MSMIIDGTNGLTYPGGQLEVGPLTAGTAQATTSGTSFTFSSIPSWVKRITVIFSGTTISASNYLIQIGSGSTSNSGYLSSCVLSNSGSTANTTSTAGFVITNYSNPVSGQFVLTLIGSNTWIGAGLLSATTTQGAISSAGGASPALAGALDRVIITTVSGSATFSTGSINIMYE
jgi:hypothetical protein